MEYYVSGVLLRSSQIVIDASIWIAFGCFIAAIFRNMTGPEKTRALFGNDTRYGLLIGWAVGMLIPVCSLGVIPVVRELYRAGVKPGTIIAFGLTAPLFNPLSVLYGLSLSDPLAVIIFSAAAMVIVTAMGAIWGVMFRQSLPDSDSESTEETVPSTGLRRSLAVLHSACTELAGWSLVYIGIGVLASAALAASFEHGSLQGETEPDKIFAPAFMACYVTPIYSTPLLAMSQIGGMFQHGNSVGAAFSLLVLGAGVNVGVFCWFGSAFGVRRVLLFLLLLLSLTIALAYAMDKPLYPEGVTPSGHTHAFDVYTHPYPATKGKVMDLAVEEIQQYHKKHAFGGTFLLLVLAIAGFGLRIAESRWDFRNWYQKEREARNGWDIALPPWVIGVVACTGLVAVSIAGTFVYYPDPDTVLDDLSVINADCVVSARTGDWEAVKKWVLYCDDLSRRLEVGVFLRQGSVSEFRRAKARVYRDKLDELRDNIEVGQTENVGEQAMDLHRAFLKLRTAFRDN